MKRTPLVLIALLLGALAAAAPAKPPNILFCFADDWGRYASADAGVEARPSINQVVKTPNIDRVAREGVLIRQLEDLGELDNTLVVISGDGQTFERPPFTAP